MSSKQNKKLIVKVLILGIVIAILSYLFHPDVGQFNLTINGKPVADPLIRFAAIPTFLAFLGIAILLSVLIFLGFSLLMFLIALGFALTATVIIAPYFWPLLAIIFLIIALATLRHDNSEPH
ncbi:hypothetical protein [Methylomicrobium sp. Wu6]|uniref:hypothetical protein n=1 Tax=Methylomicrobium sp. Wu6 TaxID=3107928 RepID=UPI002DD68549|nr:hypothetical protein [Methylomicrobium sp. Wu6]MEC4748645.1 hypothetical protein [Methylomicrobium sp. Wu6]